MENHIGTNIKKRLGARKKKQRELAEHCKVTDNAVAKWIKTGQVTLENAICAADFLQCSLDDLIGRQTPYDVFTNQLLYLFCGMSDDHKHLLLTIANELYAQDQPKDKKADPFPNKPKPAAEGVEQ